MEYLKGTVKNYKGKKNILVILDITAMCLSFVYALGMRYVVLLSRLGSELLIAPYAIYFLYAAGIYIVASLLIDEPRIEKQSYGEIFAGAIKQQIIFFAAYIVFFFVFRQELTLSRVVVGLFFMGNVVLCSLFRILYHNHILAKQRKYEAWQKANAADAADKRSAEGDNEASEESGSRQVRHVYIIGCKSIGMYGGYESFVMNLLKQHENNPRIKYHVACKANGEGHMEVEKLPGAARINDEEFTYCNVHCFLIKVPQIGAAQAIYYDLRALRWACEHIEKNHISEPIVYVLASRVGPFMKKFTKRVHNADGMVYQNPDGHEDWRRKWNILIRKYWKFSERYAVKNADLVVCDSKNIEEYIRDEYSGYQPRTTFIAYGADSVPSTLADDNTRFRNWITEHNLSDSFYISVGRFVAENNFEIMIREFMKSNTKKDFAIVTTENLKYAEALQQKLQYKKDKRIKFVGTVYDAELLHKIREHAYGYFHGHEVGGTNPSLLESLASTRLNLLLDVGFNREVAEDSALYWSKEEGSLAGLIDQADRMTCEEIEAMGKKAKQRITDHYSWKKICDQYEDIFLSKKWSGK